MGNDKYTHGGSAGKNIVLFVRALANIAAFAVMWYGFATLDKGTINAAMAILGTVLTVILIWVNMIMPFIKRAGRR